MSTPPDSDSLTRFFINWIKVSPFQRILGLSINILGLGVLIMASWKQLQTIPMVPEALLAGSIAAACTAIGAACVLFSRNLSKKFQDGLLGFGAGVMLAACAFSLLLPGLDTARNLGAENWQAAGIVGLSLLMGSSLMLLIDRNLPHEHFIKGTEGPKAIAVRRTWLFVFAITLHNFPEGLAIGVAYASSEAQGAALATGISIQDIPEGFVVAMALMGVGYSRTKAILVGAASGLIEPLGAGLGAGIVSHSALLLPWGLGFAAGAMLFVVSHEIIPESHRKGHEVHATSGLIIGFILMMMLDNGF